MILNTTYAQKLNSDGQAGSLYYSCLIDQTIQTNLTNCSVTITGDQYLNNAANDGGAILYIKDRPIIDSTTIFSNNSAHYASNMGSYPGNITMNFLNNHDYVNPYNASSMNGTNSTASRLLQANGSSSNPLGYVPPLVSGNPMDFDIYIYD